MRKPGKDCYCVEEIDSIFVEGTIKYCIMNFVECEVYKSLLTKRLLLKLSGNFHGKQCVNYDK